MAFVIAITAAAHLRKEASHTSEIVSQLLLGETAIVIEQTKNFTKIKCSYDAYEGWCQTSQLAATDSEILSTEIFIADAIGTVTVNGKPCRVSIATPFYKNDITATNFILQYPQQNICNASTTIFNAENIKLLSFQYLNTPYLWGGKSVFGIDCSGFTQQVFKMLNIKLLRDAYQQATQGEAVGFLQETQCGDLAFFDNAEGKITHVGILLSNEEIIHAAGRVRIDKIDNAGIINVETGERTHQLRIIKRYV